jgi:hypothetical protein
MNQKNFTNEIARAIGGIDARKAQMKPRRLLRALARRQLLSNIKQCLEECCQ